MCLESYNLTDISRTSRALDIQHSLRNINIHYVWLTFVDLIYPNANPNPNPNLQCPMSNNHGSWSALIFHQITRRCFCLVSLQGRQTGASHQRAVVFEQLPIGSFAFGHLVYLPPCNRWVVSCGIWTNVWISHKVNQSVGKSSMSWMSQGQTGQMMKEPQVRDICLKLCSKLDIMRQYIVPALYWPSGKHATTSFWR